MTSVRVLGVLALCVLGCATRRPAAAAAPAPSSSVRAGVALVEWQFPADDLPAASSLQTRLPASDPGLAPAFAPNQSELSATDGEALQERLQRHAREVAAAYASDPKAPAPLLLQVSAALPGALSAAFDGGVRVVAFSTGSHQHLGWMEAFTAEHPAVLFVVAAPHIAGNSASLEEIDEVPSNLAGKSPNVLLVGCLEPSADGEAPLDPARPLWVDEGPRGDRDRPARVDNQPIGKPAPIVFIEGCEARSARYGGPGATSTAVPVVAAEILGDLPRDPTVPVGSWLPGWLAARPTTWAVEEDGTVHAVPVLDVLR